MLRRHFFTTLCALGIGLCATPGRAADELSAPVQKTLKTLIGAIRYSKDDLAAKQLSVPAMGQAMLGDAAGKLSPAQRQQFDHDLDLLLRRISFRAGHDLFKYLDAVLYSPAERRGNQVHCRCTVVVHRDLKKQEIPIEWVLEQQAGRYLVVDMVSGGESTVEAIRNDQVMPLLSEGGAAALLEAMQKKLREAS